VLARRVVLLVSESLSLLQIYSIDLKGPALSCPALHLVQLFNTLAQNKSCKSTDKNCDHSEAVAAQICAHLWHSCVAIGAAQDKENSRSVAAADVAAALMPVNSIPACHWLASSCG